MKSSRSGKAVVKYKRSAASPDLVWLARVWFFWPQIAALLLAYGLGQALFVSRFLGYTTLGGVILAIEAQTKAMQSDAKKGGR